MGIGAKLKLRYSSKEHTSFEERNSDGHIAAARRAAYGLVHRSTKVRMIFRAYLAADSAWSKA